MSGEAGQAHLDTYLAQVRRHLRGLSDADARATVAALQARVLERVAGDLTPARVEAAIAELGNPREMAREQVTERVAAEMEVRRTPLGVVGAVARLAGLSVIGFLTFLVSLVGYSIASGFLVVAAWKPFAPAQVGLWHATGADERLSFVFGVTDEPGARELLGWWIIPLGLAIGLAVGYLTWRFGVASVRAMRRGARRPAASAARKAG